MAEIASEVELVDITEIVPYSNNPKRHPAEQVRKIASSIKHYGWDQPIVVTEDNEVIKGHGRLQAAELLDLELVPVIVREDLSEAEARAARIADNKTSEASWAEDALAAEVEILDLEDTIDLETLGFSDFEIDELLEPADLDIPEEFAQVNADEIETEHICPSCGYEW